MSRAAAVPDTGTGKFPETAKKCRWNEPRWPVFKLAGTG